jgi:predicted ATP-grasp superfamily ATP-dependent carboligase
MCFGRTEANATVSDEAGKLLRHLRYEGVASIEFKLCPSDGQYYFIEMNPRLPWYNSLFCDSGANLPLLSYADLTGSGAGEAQAAPREGVHWLAMQEDLGWLARSQTRRLDQVARWFCSVLRARSFAWWTLRDPLPGMYAALSFVMAAGAGILERCRLWRRKPIRERTAESGHLTTASTALCKEK